MCKKKNSSSIRLLNKNSFPIYGILYLGFCHKVEEIIWAESELRVGRFKNPQISYPIETSLLLVDIRVRLTCFRETDSKCRKSDTPQDLEFLKHVLLENASAEMAALTNIWAGIKRLKLMIGKLHVHKMKTVMVLLDQYFSL